MRSILSVLLIMVGLVVVACSDKKTDSDKIVDEFKEAGEKMEHTMDKGVRAVKDGTCEMFDSEVECAAEKAKHKAQNAMDDAEEAVQ